MSRPTPSGSALAGATSWRSTATTSGGIYLDGTPEDLAVFNRTHPDVLEHTSRTTAYEEQVCEG